ncbi:MAG: tetratricopeptide repeat protein [Spirochaetes bacterium]|nr:tetratricopeptide repeat protein [Spirochaetota bacterium]
MPKRQVSIKKYLIFLIIVGAGVYSYFNSQEVYSYYMKIYYEKFRGLTIEQQITKAEELYTNKEYEKLEKYLKDLMMAYPENSDLRRLKGLNLIKLGRRSNGAEAILDTSDEEPIPEKILEETVLTLFEQGQYRDIERIFHKRKPGTNPNLLFCYGVALFETGNHEKASEYLKKAIKEGRTDYSAYLYAGKALEKKGDTRGSLPYLEQAHDMKEEDTDTARALANAYRRLGRYDDSARILRKIKE